MYVSIRCCFFGFFAITTVGVAIARDVRASEPGNIPRIWDNFPPTHVGGCDHLCTWHGYIRTSSQDMLGCRISSVCYIVVVDAFHPPPTRLTFFNQAAKFASLQNTDSTRLLTLVAFQYAKDGRMTHVIAAAARRRHSLHRILLP